ncbi:class I SAM-dependent methyltransferase [Amycolatopsis acidiphila]|uniref:Class I SAM-dependent methyltransferase n=1 Tax=Amycolatopsis acidiphila TaxID=715473 RepID=A0A558AN82_9PSEU|nr:class I SAM-dependent methyltransferase [Amycolatopsis acidiphila]TVT25723.1 class I SAM-dependent methyltransferase [Amycolatopsis acidiphila]UIJ60485.1 class I SAM-dependent methyltransferase [Amycolatopsis acidiphila]GHG82629.1 hypothetical protein GCM10017788_53310 [Amycolatopsis acidiphila]
MARGKLLGTPTRGTTNPNRLRRVDRWLTASPRVAALLRHAADPLVVDLGYGASGITTMELAHRLHTICARVRVLGLELDPERVAAALPLAEPPWLDFRQGGFELADARPVVVRAFNVLRQYAEDEVPGAWKLILDRMAPGGLLVEGTCDEIGRLSSWVALSPDGPLSLTVSYKLSTLDRPSTVAERLPKALIHRNVPGEPVHEFLSLLDSCWTAAAPHQAFGVRFRWLRTIDLLRARGWPVLDGPRRWRLGELTVPWHTVAPL